ncbi:unnamed protein product [Rotaria sordida]|uniref:AIG1-type G domain-containing protein n=1 Tax=Rotaria sordida TaxID=392033 RepID=A0A815DX63_9BILA|nr:unnamed protein product [Rotaria sordida]CAF3834365.1 unnamed protein product [Rotaria sordida]
MASSQDQLRIVLIGRTGNGKSSIGNSLLHSRSAFYSTQSPNSITKTCEVKTAIVPDIDGRQKQLMVVDTPGFFDTDICITNEQVQQIIASQIFTMTSPGVHAFLIILRVGRFSPEEKNTVDFIKKIFGDGAAKYCIVIFTREDQLDEGQTIDDFINRSDELKDLIQKCGNRKFTINNKINGEPLDRKTKQLLQMIDRMVQNNNGNYYTNDEYQRIERQRKEEKAKREEEERRKKKEYEHALVAKAREEERQKAEKREREAREEERRKAEKREQQIRDEERKRAERCEQEERERRIRAEEDARNERRRNEEREQSTARSRRNYDDDNDFLSNEMRQMMLGSHMPSPNISSMCMPYQTPMPTNSTIHRGSSGRFTGEFMATRGSANNQPIMEGSRGGRFYWNANGNKTYVRK